MSTSDGVTLLDEGSVLIGTKRNVVFDDMLELWDGMMVIPMTISSYGSSWKLIRKIDEFRTLENKIRSELPSNYPNFPKKCRLSCRLGEEKKMPVKSFDRLEAWTSHVLKHTLENKRGKFHQTCADFFDLYNPFRFARNGDLEALTAIGSERIVGRRDSAGGGPLHYAMASGNQVAAQLLLDLGCQSSADKKGWEPEMFTANEYPHSPKDYGVPRRPFHYSKKPEDRSFLVLINPFAGTKIALALVETVVKPVFRSYGVTAEYIVTNKAGHAEDIAAELQLNKYDAIVSAGGDGLLFEIIQGFKRHKYSANALNHPLGMIPCGSGNSLASTLNIKSVFHAAHIVATGCSRPMDFFQFEQNELTRVGFVWAGWGVISAVDFYSEWARCLGSLRFDMQAAIEIIKGTKHAATVQYRRKGSDEIESRDGEFELCMGINVSHLDQNSKMSLTESLIDSGHLELLLSTYGDRLSAIKGLLGLSDGSFLKGESVDKIDVDEFWIKPAKGLTGPPIDIDGEEYPVLPIHVKCLARRGTVIGM